VSSETEIVRAASAAGKADYTYTKNGENKKGQKPAQKMTKMKHL
jgi:hypothetical protein